MAVSDDVVMLKTLVGVVLFGVVAICELERRIPRVGGTLYDVGLRDRAISLR